MHSAAPTHPRSSSTFFTPSAPSLYCDCICMKYWSVIFYCCQCDPLALRAYDTERGTVYKMRRIPPVARCRKATNHPRFATGAPQKLNATHQQWQRRKLNVVVLCKAEFGTNFDANCNWCESNLDSNCILGDNEPAGASWKQTIIFWILKLFWFWCFIDCIGNFFKTFYINYVKVLIKPFSKCINQRICNKQL
jgi:hypothetical protein